MSAKLQPSKVLALFDFDGTITNKDSFLEFLRYCFGDFRTGLGLIIMSPVILGYLVKITPNYIAKEKVFSYFFRDMPEEVFSKLARSFSGTQIDKILRTEAIARITWHKSKGHRVVIVSASMESWLASWCEVNGLDLIGTIVQVNDGVLTGRFETPNCYGEEKVKRLKNIFNAYDYRFKYAYGDSRGDRELLELAENAHYKPFRQ